MQPQLLQLVHLLLGGAERLGQLEAVSAPVPSVLREPMVFALVAAQQQLDVHRQPDRPGLVGERAETAWRIHQVA